MASQMVADLECGWLQSNDSAQRLNGAELQLDSLQKEIEGAKDELSKLRTEIRYGEWNTRSMGGCFLLALARVREGDH